MKKVYPRPAQVRKEAYMKLILASGSPRRKEILELGGYEYEVAVSNIEEKMDETEPDRLVKSLSRQKALAVLDELTARTDKNAKDAAGSTGSGLNGVYEDEILVIGADTVVACEGRILGKPKDKEDARAMITLISGREHEVYTGVTLAREGCEPYTFCEVSKVYVDSLMPEEIESYISSSEPYDKAGGYAIQGAFAKHISKIDGDYYNIMGFPLSRFKKELRAL